MADRARAGGPLKRGLQRLVTRLTRRRLTMAATVVAAASLSWNATALNLGGDRPTTILSTAFLSPLDSPRNTEGLLVKSLLEITQGHTRLALDTIEELLRQVPNFKLAHLVRGDLLMARARELNGFGAAPEAPNATITDFREEARVRLKHYLTQQTSQSAPEQLWQLAPEQKYAIVVDTGMSRLYLYRNEDGKAKYVADYYVTIGRNGSEKQKEGDKRTPLGIYFAGSKLPEKLPDFYGTAAFPLNYPNEWDQHQGKDGHGIWLHGTPSDTYSRPPRASDGCVVLTNPDIQALAPILNSGSTPVIITRDLQLLEENQLADKKQTLLQAIEEWRRSWQSQQTEAYLDHYSRDFFWKGRDYEQWAQEKRRIQSGQSPASIMLSNISMLRYPNAQQDMVVVSFDQEYKSRKLDDRMRKRQYWILEDNRWKILYEGAA